MKHKIRRIYKGLRADPWSTWLAVWAIATAVTFTLDAIIPNDTFNPATPIDSGIPEPIVLVDGLFYLAGGVLTLWGLGYSRLAVNARRPINIEQVGWLLTITAAAANLLIVLIAVPHWALTITWTSAVILGGIGRFLQLLGIERRADQVADVLARVEANNQRLAKTGGERQ